MSVRAGVQEETWGQIGFTEAVKPPLTYAKNMMPFLIIAAIIGGTILFAISCKSSTVSFGNGTKVATLNIEVADTPAKQTRGLMGRTSLAKDSGMLFDFKGDAYTPFFMKDTSIPLSIAFIDSGGKVLVIEDMAPFDLTPIESPGKYRYAIEANQGWFEKHGIRPGYRATIEI
jgi:hypothetical protein